MTEAGEATLPERPAPELLPGMPDFETRRVALTPAQVGEYGLPSTAL